MSLQSMQLLGSNKYIMNLYNFQKSEQQIKADLRQKFPGETTADINAAFSAAIGGISAAQIYNENGPDDPYLQGLIPSGGGPGDCYRFHVLGVVTDEMTGTNQTVQIPVDFETIPSQDDLDAALSQATIDRYGVGPVSYGKYKNLPDPVFTPYETLLIEGC